LVAGGDAAEGVGGRVFAFGSIAAVEWEDAFFFGSGVCVQSCETF